MLICTLDTNIVVLAVGTAECLKIDELWVAFGTRKSFIFLAHEMALTSVEEYPHLMPSLSMMPCQALEAGTKTLHGIHGRPVMRSLQPSVPWVIHQTPYS